MEKRNIAFSPADMTEAEINEVADCLRSGWITTGPRTKKLEKLLAGMIGVPNCVCLNSATAAEELSLRIIGIGEGDEVIVPAYTYTSSAAAAIHVGATVKFIDCQKDSLEMDYDALEKAITEKTKAIVPVDLAGIPCDYDRVFKIVESKKELFRAGGNTELGKRIQKAINRVFVVADCAHALGATYHGIQCGNIADFSSFSFHAVKNFTTAEGGAATWKSIPGVDDADIYHWFQLYSLHGQSKDALAKTQLGAWEYDVVAPLYKCNMTDVLASLGLVQFERYPSILARRKEIIEKYNEGFKDLGIEVLDHYNDEHQSSGHLYITRVLGYNDAQRREIIIKMAEAGIACNVHYKPLPMMTAYKAYGWDIKNFPNAYAHYVNEITLPLHTCLKDEEVEYIIENYCEIVREYVD